MISQIIFKLPNLAICIYVFLASLGILTSIAEWRKRILMSLGARISYTKFLSRRSIFEQFGDHVDDNTAPALQSLVDDRLVFRYYGDHDYNDSYVINPSKSGDIITIVTEDVEEKAVIIPPYEPDFEGYSFWFYRESEGRSNNSSRYLYYRKNGDIPDFKVLIQNKTRSKTTKCDMGSFSDSHSRISHLWNAIDNVIKTDFFIKRDVEKIDPIASGNNRQPLKAAFDIFEKLGYITRVTRGSKTMYKKTGKRPVFYTSLIND
jgi:hypothetical protein